MTRDKLLDIIFDNDLENLIIAQGLEEATVAITTNKKQFVLDYFKCLDILLKKMDMDFDTAKDTLDELTELDFGDRTPIFIKYL